MHVEVGLSTRVYLEARDQQHRVFSFGILYLIYCDNELKVYCFE